MGTEANPLGLLQFVVQSRKLPINFKPTTDQLSGIVHLLEQADAIKYETPQPPSYPNQIVPRPFSVPEAENSLLGSSEPNKDHVPLRKGVFEQLSRRIEAYPPSVWN